MAFQTPELNKLVLDLGLAGRRSEEEVKRITEEHIGRVSDTMRSLVSVDTGATLESISDEVTSGQGTVTGESGPTTRQAIFLEYGTSRMGPQAFAGPSLDRHSADYEKAIADATSRFL